MLEEKIISIKEMSKLIGVTVKILKIWDIVEFLQRVCLIFE